MRLDKKAKNKIKNKLHKLGSEEGGKIREEIENAVKQITDKKKQARMLDNLKKGRFDLVFKFGDEKIQSIVDKPTKRYKKIDAILHPSFLGSPEKFIADFSFTGKTDNPADRVKDINLGVKALGNKMRIDKRFLNRMESVGKGLSKENHAFLEKLILRQPIDVSKLNKHQRRVFLDAKNGRKLGVAQLAPLFNTTSKEVFSIMANELFDDMPHDIMLWFEYLEPKAQNYLRSEKDFNFKIIDSGQSRSLAYNPLLPVSLAFQKELIDVVEYDKFINMFNRWKIEEGVM